MTLKNEEIVFNIPCLSMEWIFNAKLYLDKNEEIFNVCSQSDEIIGTHICNFCIYHTIIGDISKFFITCPDFSNEDLIFECYLQPILNHFCRENLIELKFEYLNYE
jgi:hypothetical protein